MQLREQINDAQQPNRKAVNRVHRENDLLRSKVQSLESERDDLKQRLQAATEALKSEHVRADQHQQSQSDRIAVLESSNSELLNDLATQEQANKKLSKELNLQLEQLREAQTENSKLLTSLHQYK